MTEIAAGSEHDGYDPEDEREDEMELLRHEVEALEAAIEVALAEDETR